MNLRDARKNKDFSQLEIAEKLDIPERTWRRWENGESRIPADILPAIQTILGLTDSQVLEALKTQKKAAQ